MQPMQNNVSLSLTVLAFMFPQYLPFFVYYPFPRGLAESLTHWDQNQVLPL